LRKKKAEVNREAMQAMRQVRVKEKATEEVAEKAESAA
jgi:hypothetical protein